MKQRKVARSSAPLPRPTTWLLTPRARSASGPPKKRGNNELSQLVRIPDAICSDDMHNGEDSNGKISSEDRILTPGVYGRLSRQHPQSTHS
jgi:hypothetical protein